MRAMANFVAGDWPIAAGLSHEDGAMPEEEPPRQHYRAVIISDIHLGTAGCQAEAVLDFLRHHSSDYLYLVGDIVDGWQLRRRRTSSSRSGCGMPRRSWPGDRSANWGLPARRPQMQRPTWRPGP